MVAGTPASEASFMSSSSITVLLCPWAYSTTIGPTAVVGAPTLPSVDAERARK